MYKKTGGFKVSIPLVFVKPNNSPSKKIFDIKFLGVFKIKAESKKKQMSSLPRVRPQISLQTVFRLREMQHL